MIHSCSYYCHKPECIKAQRDELRDKLYKREWIGLTADELNMIGDRMRTWNSHSLADVYVAIEAKLKEKNT